MAYDRLGIAESNGRKICQTAGIRETEPTGPRRVHLPAATVHDVSLPPNRYRSVPRVNSARPPGASSPGSLLPGEHTNLCTNGSTAQTFLNFDHDSYFVPKEQKSAEVEIEQNHE